MVFDTGLTRNNKTLISVVAGLGETEGLNNPSNCMNTLFFAPTSSLFAGTRKDASRFAPNGAGPLAVACATKGAFAANWLGVVTCKVFKNLQSLVSPNK